MTRINRNLHVSIGMYPRSVWDNFDFMLATQIDISTNESTSL